MFPYLLQMGLDIMATSCILDRENGLIHGNDNRISIDGRFSGRPETLESLSLFASFAMTSLSLSGKKLHTASLSHLLQDEPGLLIGTVRQGSLKVQFQNRQIVFEVADILVLPLDSDTTLAGSTCMLDCLILSGKTTRDVHLPIPTNGCRRLPADDISTNLFSQQFTSFRAYAHLMQEDEAEDLLLPLVMTLATILKRQTTPESDRRNGLLNKFRAYVEQNLLEADLSPALIADQLGMSRSSLYRLAEPLGGVQKYIRGQRLKRAYSHLVSGGDEARSITNLAYELGFATETAFRRSFKESYGQTPTEVRRQAS